MWARGDRLPTQMRSSMMGCPCGARFDSHNPAANHVHRELCRRKGAGPMNTGTNAPFADVDTRKDLRRIVLIRCPANGGQQSQIDG
jgi:hypothetical protein